MLNVRLHKMINEDSKVEAILNNRDSLENYRVIANQPGFKYYLQTKYLILILSIIIGGIVVWVLSPKMSSNSVIPLMGYILISQLVFSRTETIRLKEQVNALREMSKLENKSSEPPLTPNMGKRKKG